MNKIAEIVKKLTEDFGSSDPFFICEQKGINVIDSDLPECVNGFTITMEGIVFIVLNNALDYYARKITAAHELGHIILHGSTNSVRLSANTSFCVSKLEREADCFAAHLLLLEEAEEMKGMESVTSEDISMLTHMPKEMVESAFFL